MVSKHLGINSLKETVMNAKLSNLSELANILSVKSEIRANILALFSRFGIGHLLCHLVHVQSWWGNNSLHLQERLSRTA